MSQAFRVCILIVVAFMGLTAPSGVSAADSCIVEAYETRVPSGERYGITLIELKREEFASESEVLAALKGYMEEMYYGPFNQVGVDHSDDDEAVELDAYEIGAILPNRDPMTVGSISGYFDGKILYTFYLENESNGAPPSSTSKFVWEIIELVQKSETHTLEGVLDEPVFDSKWKETRETVLSCR